MSDQARTKREAPPAAFVDALAPRWVRRAEKEGQEIASRAFLDWPEPRPAELPPAAVAQVQALYDPATSLDAMVQAFGDRAIPATVTFLNEMRPRLVQAALLAAQERWRDQVAMLADPEMAELFGQLLAAFGPDSPAARAEAAAAAKKE